MNDIEIIRLGLQGIKIMPLDTKRGITAKRRKRLPIACLRKLIHKRAA